MANLVTLCVLVDLPSRLSNEQHEDGVVASEPSRCILLWCFVALVLAVIIPILTIYMKAYRTIRWPYLICGFIMLAVIIVFSHLSSMESSFKSTLYGFEYACLGLFVTIVLLKIFLAPKKYNKPNEKTNSKTNIVIVINKFIFKLT